MKKDMTKGAEWKLILLFALPVMAGNILQQLYNTVDGIVVGRYVGETALSSVGTCAPLTMLFLAVAMGLSIGAGIIVSQYFGAEMHTEMSTAVNTALILMAGFGVIMSGLGIGFSRLLLKYVLRVPDHILPGALLYIRIYAGGLLFQFIYNGIASILRGVGDSKATLYFLLISAGANIVLDLVFVIVFHWGIAGAAIATVISQAACCLVSFIYMRRKLELSPDAEKYDPKTAKTILRLAIPSAIQQSIIAVGNVAMQRLVNGFGQYTIAAFTVGNRLDGFIFSPIFGLQAANANFTGQNIGAGRLDRVRRGCRATVIIALIITVIISLTVYIFAGTVMDLFSLSGESMRQGIEMVRFMAKFFWIFAIIMSVNGVIQGSGDVIMQSISTLSTLTVRVILGYGGVALGILGYSAAWCTMPIGWCVSIIITLTRYFTGGWKKKAVAGKLASQKGQE